MKATTLSIRHRAWPPLLAILLAGCRSTPQTAAPSAIAQQPGYVKAEFLWTSAPFRSAHASTIVESRHGLVAAWFGGSDEGNADVEIWLSRRTRSGWSAPQSVADGRQPDGQTRYPCWNPVLFQSPDGPLLLFYKVGPSPSRWWGMLTTSTDGGQSWSTPQRLPENILGPVRNKPVLLPDGSLLCGSSTEDDGWRLHLERTADLGRTWERTPPLNERSEAGLIQPTVLTWPSGRTQLLCRSRQGAIYESWMGARWSEWSKPQPIQLPNPNSGIDAVMLADGRALLVYNHTPRGRSPLNVAVSRDGRAWQAVLALEDQPGEYSYPAVIQSRDGRVHLTYTWKRQLIRHVELDPRRF